MRTIEPYKAEVERVRALLRDTPLAREMLSDKALDESVRTTLRARRRNEDVWIFGYGSLVWNPALRYAERRPALLDGYHRGFYLLSRINRGTPSEPGLVLGLDHGGCCRGVVYRITAAHVEREFRALWRREMLLDSYEPRWLNVHTRGKRLRALAFVVKRRASSYAGRLADEEIVSRLLRSRGIYGSAADYLIATCEGLVRRGIRDAYLERLRRRLVLRIEPRNLFS